MRIYGRGGNLATRANYRELFSLLVRKKVGQSPIWVITTNYDSVIEELLRDPDFQNQIHAWGGVARLELRTGFVPGTPARWDPQMFSAPPRTGFCPVNLVKLHGSATWKWDNDAAPPQPVDIGLALPTGDYDCLVYFGYKSIPEFDPFKTMHRLLKDILLGHAVVVSIGFRFGDPYIRETFDFAFRANRNLQVICSLTQQPAQGTPLYGLMEAFPRQVSILVGEDGTPIRFGREEFCRELEKRLESIR